MIWFISILLIRQTNREGFLTNNEDTLTVQANFSQLGNGAIKYRDVGNIFSNDFLYAFKSIGISPYITKIVHGGRELRVKNVVCKNGVTEIVAGLIENE